MINLGVVMGRPVGARLVSGKGAAWKGVERKTLVGEVGCRVRLPKNFRQELLAFGNGSTYASDISDPVENVVVAGFHPMAETLGNIECGVVVL